jgi:hypothetical protein
VRRLGTSALIWSDHPDVRPTVLTLAGLRDTYSHQGRVLSEVLEDQVLPQSLVANRVALQTLGALYKQINAPVGQLVLASVQISTRALQSGSGSSDGTYRSLEAQLTSLTSERDSLASEIEAVLEGVEFVGATVSEDKTQSLIARAQQLLQRVTDLAGGQ